MGCKRGHQGAASEGAHLFSRCLEVGGPPDARRPGPATGTTAPGPGARRPSGGRGERPLRQGPSPAAPRRVPHSALLGWPVWGPPGACSTRRPPLPGEQRGGPRLGSRVLGAKGMACCAHGFSASRVLGCSVVPKSEWEDARVARPGTLDATILRPWPSGPSFRLFCWSVQLAVSRHHLRPGRPSPKQCSPERTVWPNPTQTQTLAGPCGSPAGCGPGLDGGRGPEPEPGPGGARVTAGRAASAAFPAAQL